MIMNKKQQIEEMKKVMCEEYGKEYNYCPCSDCANAMIAENLYNAGYHKVPDGAVILTPEERDEELKACNEKQAELEAEIEILKIQNNNLEIAFDRLNARSERFESNMKSVLEIEKRKAVEEFAEKVKERLMQDRVTNDNVVIVTGVLIDELLKEYENDN